MKITIGDQVYTCLKVEITHSNGLKAVHVLPQEPSYDLPLLGPRVVAEWVMPPEAAQALWGFILQIIRYKAMLN